MYIPTGCFFSAAEPRCAFRRGRKAALSRTQNSQPRSGLRNCFASGPGFSRAGTPYSCHPSPTLVGGESVSPSFSAASSVMPQTIARSSGFSPVPWRLCKGDVTPTTWDRALSLVLCGRGMPRRRPRMSSLLRNRLPACIDHHEIGTRISLFLSQSRAWSARGRKSHLYGLAAP